MNPDQNGGAGLLPFPCIVDAGWNYNVELEAVFGYIGRRVRDIARSSCIRAVGDGFEHQRDRVGEPASRALRTSTRALPIIDGTVHRDNRSWLLETQRTDWRLGVGDIVEAVVASRLLEPPL